MTSKELIPDRFRKHFPLNGGPRPTKAHSDASHRGIAAARAILEEMQPVEPVEHPPVRRLTPEQIVRARAGIARARNALRESTHDTDDAAAA